MAVGQTDFSSANSGNAFLDDQFKNPAQFQIDQFGSGFGDKISGVRGEQSALLEDFLGRIMGQGSPEDFIQQILGGGGGGGFSFSGGGGSLTPKDIRLRSVGAEAQGLLDENLGSAESALKLQRDKQNDALLSDLFGSGLQRSTVAQDKAGRLRFGQDEALGNLRSQFNQQELDLMTKDADRRAAIEQTRLQGQAQMNSAASSGAGQAAAARAGAAAQIFGTQTRALEALFASQTGFNSNLVDEFSSMSANELAGNISAHNNLVNSATSTLNNVRSTDASIIGARTAARAQREIGQLNYASQMASLDLQRELGFAGLNMDFFKTLVGDQNLDADRDANGVSNMDRIMNLMAIFGQAALSGNGGG